MLLHDYESYPMHQSGGTYMRGEPKLADEISWMGFDMVSLANNHTGDYGVAGMRSTMRYLSRAGLVHAGVGESLAQAREARFLEVAQGRTALISVASTFPDHSRASRSRGDIPARPGLNPLRYSLQYRVPQEQLNTLRSIMIGLGQMVPESQDRLRFLGNLFVAGARVGIDSQPQEQDLSEIASVVRNASRLSDYTIVAIHAHEGDGSRFVPAQFLVHFARAMIDAGADVFVGHGPHVLRGVEVYRGKLILYSLGDFIFQNETLLRLPQENYERYELGPDHHVADFNDRRYDNDRSGFPSDPEIWESVIAFPTWQGRALVGVDFVPISLGFGKPRTVRGRPRPAADPLNRKIIEDLARLSEPFGTVIRYEAGLGRLVLNSSGPSQ
jgi:poly-gamma-glutamate synthesis protein (capsule biosynthesis protein)